MEVKTIAVIGAGTMGRGIAYASALGGYPTVLQDISASVMEKALAWIREALDEGVRRGKLGAATRDAAFRRISIVASIEEAAGDADLIIEAVPEEIALKLEVFTRLEKPAKPAAILASNTSSLSINEFTHLLAS